MKNEDVCYRVGKKLKTDSGIYGNPINLYKRKESVLCIEVTKIGEKMISFVNFARIASICVGFHLGTLHGYLFSQRLLAKFEFPARISNKTCLKLHPFTALK